MGNSPNQKKYPNQSGLLRMVTGKPDPSQTDLEVPRPTSSTSFRFSKAAPKCCCNTLRQRTVRQHGLPKRCKPGKGAGSLRGGSGTVLRVLGLVGSQPSLLE